MDHADELDDGEDDDKTQDLIWERFIRFLKK
jgi:hypothetical protein